MKTLIYQLIISIVFSTPVFSSSVYIMPTSNNWIKYAGNLSNVQIEITPIGNYAKVAISFKVNIDTINPYPGYNYNTLPNYQTRLNEAILNFEIPEGGFFNDSYLWLDENTIIRAEIIGKGIGNQIYNNIVNRKSDPSILNKVNSSNYSLKIFPIETDFARKVKLVYIAPIINYQGSKSFVELPNGILSLVASNEKIQFKVEDNSEFKFESPVYPLKANNIVKTPNTTELEININEIKKTPTSFFEFKTINTGPISFYYKPINDYEGYYELKIRPELLQDFPPSVKFFTIKLPFDTNSFVKFIFDNCQGTIVSTVHFVQTGFYHGKFNFKKPIQLDYSYKGAYHKYEFTFDTNRLNPIANQIWAHYYCLYSGTNNDALNVSLQNHVLTTYTALLALETGDTVKQASSNTYSPGLTVAIDEMTPIQITISPNPFIDKVNIVAEETILAIEIIDTKGQTRYLKNNKINDKTFELITTDLNLSDGIYFIIIQTKTKKQSYKLIKGLN